MTDSDKYLRFVLVPFSLSEVEGGCIFTNVLLIGSPTKDFDSALVPDICLMYLMLHKAKIQNISIWSKERLIGGDGTT